MIAADGAGGDQPDVPIDPRAGIPAGIRLLGVVDPDRNYVRRAAGLEERSKLITE